MTKSAGNLLHVTRKMYQTKILNIAKYIKSFFMESNTPEGKWHLAPYLFQFFRERR